MCGCISGGIAAIYIEEIEMREKRAVALFFELNFRMGYMGNEIDRIMADRRIFLRLSRRIPKMPFISPAELVHIRVPDSPGDFFYGTFFFC